MAQPTDVTLRFDTSQEKTIVATWKWSASHTESFQVEWWYADEYGIWNMSTYHKSDIVTVSAKTNISTGTIVTVLFDGVSIWSSKESSASVLETVAFGTDLVLTGLDAEYCVVKTSTGQTGYIYSKYCSESKTQYEDAIRQSTFSVPDKAARVWVYITPIAETYTVTSTDADGNQLNSAELFYWQGERSTGVGIWVMDVEQPSAPSAPTLTLADNGLTLTATVTGLTQTSTSPELRQQVSFIIKEAAADGTPSTETNAQIDSGIVTATTEGTATFQTKKTTNGHSYVALARVGIYYNSALASNGDWNASNYQLWWSDWSEPSSSVSTKPGSFTIKNVAARNESSVEISWEASAGAESYEIYYSSGTDKISAMEILTNPDSYDSSLYQKITGIGKNVSNYVISGFSEGARYYFRVKAVNSSGEKFSTLRSSIRGVSIGSTPSPPSTWSYSYVAELGDVVELYFVHNSSDNSKCTKYKVHYSVYSTDNVLVDEYEESAVPKKSSDDNDNGIIKILLDTSKWSSDVMVKWKIATAGATMEYSDWSVERTLSLYKAPVIATSFTSDVELGDDGLTYKVKSFPIVIEGTMEAGLQYPVGVQLTITNLEAYTGVDFQGRPITIPANSQIYTKTYYNDWRQWYPSMVTMTLLPMQLTLKNDTRYRIDIVASMSSGLTASQSYTIQTAWTSQTMIPEASIGYNTSLYCAYIRPRCRNISGVYITNVTLSVYRRDYDGDYVEVASGIPGDSNATVTDPHPSLNFVSYRIVAVSDETGEIAYADTQNYQVGVHAIVIQWDDVWKNFNVANGTASDQPWTGSLLVLPYNIDTSDSTNPDTSLAEYAGRSHPVSYYGTHLGTSSTWNTDIPKRDLDTLFQIRRLQGYQGDVYVREPTGVGYWANVTVTYNIQHCELTVPVTFNLKRVEPPSERALDLEDYDLIKTETIGDLENVLNLI